MMGWLRSLVCLFLLLVGMALQGSEQYDDPSWEAIAERAVGGVVSSVESMGLSEQIPQYELNFN